MRAIEATMEPFEKLSANTAACLGKKKSVKKKPQTNQKKSNKKHLVTVLKGHDDDVERQSLLSARGMFYFYCNEPSLIKS